MRISSREPVYRGRKEQESSISFRQKSIVRRQSCKSGKQKEDLFPFDRGVFEGFLFFCHGDPKRVVKMFAREFQDNFFELFYRHFPVRETVKKNR